MNTSSLKKTAVALAVTGMLATAAIPPAEAYVVNFSWSGAFTVLNPTGLPLANIPSDYASFGGPYPGYYANGAVGYGPPKYPANAVNGTPNTYYAGAVNTTHGWKGHRTPLSGTMSFDTSNGAGVGMVNPFFLLGDTPGDGVGTNVARSLEFTFQPVDSVGTLVGSVLFSWNGAGHTVSIVFDASGFLGALPGALASGPTSSISGVGALPATDGINFGTTTKPLYLPLGATPIAATTRDALGCEGQSLATLVNAWTIIPTGNIANCDLSQNDGIGGSPMPDPAFNDHNIILDITSLHYDSVVYPEPQVPLPPAVWLFGSGLLGLIGFARRKKSS